MIYGGHFDCCEKIKQIKQLEEKTMEDGFWNNKDASSEIIDEINKLKQIVEPLEELKSKINSNLELLELLEIEEDNEVLSAIEKEIPLIEKKISEISLNLLLSGKYDGENCILEIHPGAGGTESCDWAMMLYRMYRRWCRKKGYKIELLDYQDGEEAGIKSVSILIKGKCLWIFKKRKRCS